MTMISSAFSLAPFKRDASVGKPESNGAEYYFFCRSIRISSRRNIMIVVGSSETVSTG